MSFDPKVYARKGSFDPKSYAGGGVDDRGVIGELVRLLDTYTGAPPRAAFDAAMQGNNPISALVDQFGKEPEAAPTPRDLIKKYTNLSDSEPIFSGGSLERGLVDAVSAAAPYAGPLIQAGYGISNATSATPEDVGALMAGSSLDLTNLLPVAGGIKRLAKVSTALRGADEAARVAEAAKAAENMAEVAKAAKNMKPHAAQIEEAAKAFNTKPIPGQVLKGWLPEKVSGALETSPTLVGSKYREPIVTGVEEIQKFLQEALGTDMNLSKAQLGGKSKAALAGRIANENEPISQLYKMVQESTQNVPIGERSTKAIVRNIGKLDEARLSPSSEAGQFAARVQKELGNVQTVDQLKKYRTIIKRQAKDGGSDVRYIAKNIDARLKALEEGAVVREGTRLSKETKSQTFAIQAKKLVGERRAADQAYKSFKSKLTRLADKVGASDEGAGTFIDSLDSITNEQLVDKMISKNDAEFLKFMASEFPAETKDILNYQKAELLRKHTEDGMLKINQLTKELKDPNKFSPEVIQMMFNPEQQKKLGLSRVYLESLPKNINPSGTEILRGLKEAAQAPKDAAISVGKDYVFKRYLENQMKGGSDPLEALVRGSKEAINAGGRAYTPANRARRIMALESHSSDRPKLNKNARRRALGE